MQRVCQRPLQEHIAASQRSTDHSGRQEPPSPRPPPPGSHRSGPSPSPVPRAEVVPVRVELLQPVVGPFRPRHEVRLVVARPLLDGGGSEVPSDEAAHGGVEGVVAEEDVLGLEVNWK